MVISPHRRIIIPTAIPTGGAISLAISGAVSGVFSLSRAVSGQSFSVISSGTTFTPLQLWIDAGDGLPEPLNQTSSTTTNTRMARARSRRLRPALCLPSDHARSDLTAPHSPSPGRDQLPPIPDRHPTCPGHASHACRRRSQASARRGQSRPFPTRRRSNRATLWRNQPDHGRHNHHGVLQAHLSNLRARNRRHHAELLQRQPCGDLRSPPRAGPDPPWACATHRWQGLSYQVASDRLSKAPGFFGVDFMLEFTGTFNVAINTAYGLIESFNVTIVETS